MKNSFVLAVLISLIFSFSKAYSQGIFLEKGEAGFFANGGYSSLESGHATSFGGGFALGGVLEFGISSFNSKIEIDKDNYSKQIEINGTNYSVAAVLVNKKAQLEVNFGLTTSDNGRDAALIGFTVGSEFVLHEKISWYPIFSFALGFPLEKNGSNPVTALGLAVPILIAEHFYLGPTFALSEGDFSWGVTAGILISFNTSSTSGL
jgi:hypothetical protein